MEESTGPGRKEKCSAVQVKRLCAKMALTPNALRKVDFPEALEPVSKTSELKDPLLGAGVRSRGWYSLEKMTVFFSWKLGEAQYGRLFRKDKVLRAASSRPALSKKCKPKN